MKLDEEAILREFLRRQAAQEASAGVIESIRRELFDKQLDFIDDPSREKAALCTRRAGKTSMWARYAVIVCLRKARSLVRIWGVTRLRTKQLLWQELKDVCLRNGVVPETGPKYFNETELTAKLPNGSEIRLLGADKDRDAEKKRGDKTDMEVVLEAQLFASILENLVENIAGPCLFDTKGTFCLEGTPGPLCVGYWFDVSGGEDFRSKWESRGNPKTGKGAGWSLHRWSLLDNPHLPHARTELAEIKRKRRWGDDNATYLREYLGRWVNDLGSLYYAYDPARNSFSTDDVQPWGPGWEHTLGWDLGARDDMALVVWGFHPNKAELYEAFSWKKPGALSAEIMTVLGALEKPGFTDDGKPRAAFNFVKKVADTGGGGKMYVEDLQSRYAVHFDAAKKTDKYDHVRLLNEDLRSGFVRLQYGSVLAEEMASLPRDPDWPDPDKPEKPPQEDPRFPNHACFVAGTLVRTDDEERPIEWVREGDLVWTRKGLRRVTKAAPTGNRYIWRVVLADGRELLGTDDHPVWTQDGWKPLALLTPTDAVDSWRTSPIRVLRVEPTASVQPVYALSVDGVHEFFANGVVVSNCDAALYSYRACRHYLHVPEEVKAVRGSPQWVTEEERRMEQWALRGHRARVLPTWDLENETDATWDE